MPTERYDNLRAEMARKPVTASELANLLGHSRSTRSQKLAGKYDLLLWEAALIAQVLNLCGEQPSGNHRCRHLHTGAGKIGKTGSQAQGKTKRHDYRARQILRKVCPHRAACLRRMWNAIPPMYLGLQAVKRKTYGGASTVLTTARNTATTHRL